MLNVEALTEKLTAWSRRASFAICAVGLPWLSFLATGRGAEDAARRTIVAPEPTAAERFSVSPSATPEGADPAAETPSAPVPAASVFAVRLEQLLRLGDFSRFVEEAETAAEASPLDSRTQFLAGEAFLATGRLDRAEETAWRALELAARENNKSNLSRAAKLWMTVRLRQGAKLDFPGPLEFDPAADATEGAAALLRWWRQELAGNRPYRLAPGPNEVVLPLVRRRDADAPGESPEGIEIEINGVAVPLAFIDTGAQFTVISSQMAEAAGIKVGPPWLELAGFATSEASPALVGELRLGELVLHDVPVCVADTAPLASSRGQAALGLDLMHHVCFTVDYPRHKAIARPADNAAWSLRSQTADWEIPLWTFSQVSLAQGRLPSGQFARTMIDTGNRSGTFASTRWAKRTQPTFARPVASRRPWFHARGFTLLRIDLGGRRLEEWEVGDRLPAELERMDLVDLLIGHDLLENHAVTIDLVGRRLVLEKGL